MTFKLLTELFYPPESGPAGTAAPEMDKEDVIDFLGEDDKPETIPLADEKPKKDAKPDKEDEEEEINFDTKKEDEDEEEEDEEDELKELEDELKEPTEEQLELVTPVRRREILKKYPNVFKDFPYLEKAYYREQQFTELLPTIDDAKSAIEKAETFDKFDNDLRAGNTEDVLKAIKQTNPRAFNKVVDDYMTTLSKVDNDAYLHVIGNTIKHTISAMVQEGRRSNNEALISAAQILNQYTFGTSDYTPPKKLTTEEPDNTEQKELQRERQQFVQQKYESARNDLNSRVNNTLKATIVANIDPKDSMSEYIKKNATREATEMLENLIEKDSRFKAIVDKLWEAAFKANFSKESTDRIRSAFTSKARTLLPSVIKKARNEALRGVGRRVEKDDESSSDKKGPIKAEGRSQSHSSDKRTREIPKDMSTLDYLNSD